MVAFGYAQVLTPLSEMNQPILFNRLLRSIDKFLEAAGKGNVRSNGFTVNRQANNILHQVQGIIDSSKRCSNDAIALAAIDFERDEARLLESMIENTLRNMLLG